MDSTIKEHRNVPLPSGTQTYVEKNYHAQKSVKKKTIRSFAYLAIRTRVGILHAQSSRFALARRMRDQELAHANAKTPRPDGPG